MQTLPDLRRALPGAHRAADQARARRGRDRRPEDRDHAASCPGIEWLSEQTIATTLDQQLTGGGSSSKTGEPAPGLHGTGLESVSVGDTTPAARRAQPHPGERRTRAFVVRFTNQGENDEFDVKVTVTIEGGGKPIKAVAHGRHRRARAQTAEASVPLGHEAADRRRGDREGDGRARCPASRRPTTTTPSTTCCSPRASAAAGSLRVSLVSLRAVNDLTDPAGIAALSAGALAFIALLARDRARVPRAQAAGGAEGGARRAAGRATSSPTPPGCSRRSTRCTSASRRSPRSVDQRLGVAEARLDGAIAYRSLVRYDAYGELTGNQSTTIALLDAQRNGVVMSSIVRRDTARIYCKLVHRRAGRARALARGGRGRAARPGRRRRRHAAGMRVGFLGPAGTYSQEAVFAGPGTENYEPVPLPSVHDAVMAVHEGRVERALVPIENSLEGAVNATLDTLAFETEDVQIAGELVLPIHHCLIARDPIELERIAAVASHPQASGQCATFLRTRLPHAAVVDAASTADAVRIVAERDGRRAVGRARQPRGGRALRLRGAGLAASRTRRARRRASCGSPARRRIPAIGGRVEDRADVLGADRRPPGLARALPGRVRRPRGQPHPDRVAAAPARARHLHVLRRSRRPRATIPRWPRRSVRCAPTPKACGCSGRSRRPP